MRSNEERVAEVKRRIEQNKRQEELQRSRIVMASVVAASLLVIAGLSAFMPGIAGQISTDSYSHYGMTASICFPTRHSSITGSCIIDKCNYGLNRMESMTSECEQIQPNGLDPRNWTTNKSKTQSTHHASSTKSEDHINHSATRQLVWLERFIISPIDHSHSSFPHNFSLHD